jgi:hypothetical protein
MMKSVAQWVSKRQMLDLMDAAWLQLLFSFVAVNDLSVCHRFWQESEAEEMLEEGTLQTRKNPLNKKRLQFRALTTTEERECAKEKQLKSSGCQAITSGQFGGLNKNLEKALMDEKTLKMSESGKFHKMLGDDSDNDDEEAAEPKAKAKAKGKAKAKAVVSLLKGNTKAKSLKDDDDEGEEEEEEETDPAVPPQPEEPNHEANAKKLTGAMSRNLLSLGMFLNTFRGSDVATKPKIAKLQASFDEAGTAKSVLEGAIIHKAAPAKFAKYIKDCEEKNKTILADIAMLKKVLSADDCASVTSTRRYK